MSHTLLLRCAALLTIALSSSGCTTIVLWDWAGQREAAGHLAGVVAAEHGEGIVVYRFDGPTQPVPDTLEIHIPPEWQDRPVRILATSPDGDALALAEPLVPLAGIARSSGSLSLPREIDFRNTIGPQQVAIDGEEGPLGFVALVNETGEVVHELYGYDRHRGQWIRLTTVSLGPYDTHAGRTAAGVTLTPLAVALDVAIAAALVCAVVNGSSLSGLDVPSFGGDDEPTHVTERDAYWQGLVTEREG